MLDTANVIPQDSKSIRIVQYTDLHLFDSASGTLLGVNTADSYQAVLNESLPLNSNADFFIFTGDLSQDFSEGSYRRFVDMSSQINKPYFSIPGNHDDGPAMQRFFEKWNVPIARQIFCGNWQILLLFSPIYSNPAGYLRDDQFGFIFECLEKYKNLNTMICVHHNTLKVDCAWLDQHCLHNGEDFRNFLRQYPKVRCVLCGHVHQEIDITIDSIRFLATPSTCIQFLPRVDYFGLDDLSPGWRELVLHPDGSIDTTVRRLSKRDFVPIWNSKGY